MKFPQECSHHMAAVARSPLGGHRKLIACPECLTVWDWNEWFQPPETAVDFGQAEQS